MKKRTIIALIVAAVLIFAGGLLLVLGLSFAGDSTRESTLITREVTVTEDFDKILIDTDISDVKFVPYNGAADPQVTFREQENIGHSVTVEDGTLKIQMVDERNWTDHIGIFDLFGQLESPEITLYLPNTQYASVRISTDTGDIQIPGTLDAWEVLLRTDTGDISCVGISGDVLDCMSATGDISVQNSVPNVMRLQSDTGDCKVRVAAGDEIHMITTTGDKELENVTCKRLTCESNTGDVELEQVNAEEYLQVFTTTGDVEIESCDAGVVNIETDTGDVSGHFLSSKWFQAHSDTGNVKVPHTREGGECRIESNTGSIHFE